MADPGFVKRGGGQVSKLVKRGGRMDDITQKRADFCIILMSKGGPGAGGRIGPYLDPPMVLEVSRPTLLGLGLGLGCQRLYT